MYVNISLQAYAYCSCYQNTPASIAACADEQLADADGGAVDSPVSVSAFALSVETAPGVFPSSESVVGSAFSSSATTAPADVVAASDGDVSGASLLAGLIMPAVTVTVTVMATGVECLSAREGG